MMDRSHQKCDVLLTVTLYLIPVFKLFELLINITIFLQHNGDW